MCSLDEADKCFYAWSQVSFTSLELQIYFVRVFFKAALQNQLVYHYFIESQHFRPTELHQVQTFCLFTWPDDGQLDGNVVIQEERSAAVFHRVCVCLVCVCEKFCVSQGLCLSVCVWEILCLYAHITASLWFTLWRFCFLHFQLTPICFWQ